MSSTSVPATIRSLQGNYSYSSFEDLLIPSRKIMGQKPTPKRDDDRLLPYQSYFVIHDYFLIVLHLTSVGLCWILSTHIGGYKECFLLRYNAAISVCFMPVSCFVYSSILKMDDIYSSKTSVRFRLTTRRYLPIDIILR
jgi:hypothetical protein